MDTETTAIIGEVIVDTVEQVGLDQSAVRPAVDLAIVAGEYLRGARRETAVSRWKDFCPPELQSTDWQDRRLAPYAELHTKILGWEYQRRGILATGPTGRGKSRAMWQLMRQLADSGREIRYFTAQSWFAKLQSQITYGRDDALGWVAAVAAAPIVFIDDLGQEAVATNKQDWCSGWLFQFLDLRLGFGLPLFVTTNLSATDIAGQSTATRANPLVRRLLELCEPVKF